VPIWLRETDAEPLWQGSLYLLWTVSSHLRTLHSPHVHAAAEPPSVAKLVDAERDLRWVLEGLSRVLDLDGHIDVLPSVMAATTQLLEAVGTRNSQQISLRVSEARDLFKTQELSGRFPRLSDR
jgi:hypothetical protein